MSMTLSLLREFVLSVPLIIFLPKFMNLGVMGPLYSGPISDIISCTVAIVFMGHVFKQMDTSTEWNTDVEETTIIAEETIA